MLKAVVFDFDETLVKNTEFIKEHIIRVIERFPSPKKLSEKKKKDWQKKIRELTDVNTNFAEMFDILFGKEKGFEYLENYRLDSKEQKYNPVDGALEFVEELKKKGIKLYILSNRTKMLDLRAEQAGFDSSDFEIYSVPDGHEKPDPISYQPILEKLKENGYQYDEVLFIGNNVKDFKGLPSEWSNRFRAMPFTEIQKSNFLKDNFPQKYIFENYSELFESIKESL